MPPPTDRKSPSTRSVGPTPDPMPGDEGPTRQQLLDVLGGRTVLGLVGEGATGRVYACRDEALRRIVAVKVLHPGVGQDERLVTRLHKEARAKLKVASPHVAAMHEVGQDGDDVFVVTAFLEGESLAVRLVRGGPLPEAAALALVRGCVKGLHAAWEQGVRHRDLKPSNLLVVEGRTVVTDFGVYARVQTALKGGQKRPLPGTPAFMAPEVVRGGKADHRADIYSLGCTLFTLLSGQPVFEGLSAIDVVKAQVLEPVPDLAVVRPGTSPAVVALVERLLRKDPAARPQHYGEVLQLIDDATDPFLATGTSTNMSVDDDTEVLQMAIMDEPSSRPSKVRPLPVEQQAPARKPAPRPAAQPVAAPVDADGDVRPPTWRPPRASWGRSSR